MMAADLGLSDDGTKSDVVDRIVAREDALDAPDAVEEPEPATDAKLAAALRAEGLDPEGLPPIPGSIVPKAKRVRKSKTMVQDELPVIEVPTEGDAYERIDPPIPVRVNGKGAGMAMAVLAKATIGADGMDRSDEIAYPDQVVYEVKRDFVHRDEQNKKRQASSVTGTYPASVLDVVAVEV